MLFKQDQWPKLADGSITVAFRRWRRPTVKAGGTLRTPAGVLAIDRVEVVEPTQITASDAVRAGHASPAAVLATLPDGADRRLYRIVFHHAGEDPRMALRRNDDLAGHETAAVVAALDRLDRHSSDGPWTGAALRLLAEQPAVRAGDLAAQMGQDRLRFKRRVRRLKELGLTESLDVGYRLSPRGRAIVDRLDPPGTPRDRPHER